LASTGLLLSTDELDRRARAMRDPANRPPPIGSIGIPTGGDRIALVERAVRSVAGNAQKFGRAPEFLVADNSPRPEQSARFRTLLSELHRETGCAMLVAGEKEKRAFAERLQKAGRISRETIEFALFDPLETGFSCGANRNALLLHFAGRMFCSIDDDVVCRLAASPETTEASLACRSDGDPYSRWLFADRESALKDARWIEADFLALHEKMLGRDLGEFFDSADARIDYGNAGDDFLRRMEGNRARARATYTGHVGDPGIPTSAYFLYYDGANRERLVESEAHYRSVFGSRSVLSVVPTLSVTDASVSPGMGMALDHRELLPPCFPVLHAEDFSYGAALWQCCPDALLGHLPAALYHEPGVGKSILLPSDFGPQRPVVIFEFAHLLRGAILRYDPPEHGSAADRMRAMGRHFGQIANVSAADFFEYLRRQALEQASERCEYLGKQLEEAIDAPDFWRSDVEALITQMRRAVTLGDADIPLDLKSDRPLEKTRALMQEMFRRYARLLEEWPEIVAAAQDLRENGHGLFAAAVN
jgi:hypothetical protein